MIDCRSGRVDIEEVVADEPEEDIREARLICSTLRRRCELWAENLLVA
jgi:hypothetical protein